MKGERKWVDNYVYPLFYSMELDGILETLREELKPTLDELDAEIVEFTLKRAGKNLVLRLLVDKAGGINIDECALINQRIGDIVEEKALIGERYLLEVFSPGLDRSLKTKTDFERVKGKDVEIWLSTSVEGTRYIIARVKSTDEQGVVIEDKDAKEIHLSYQSIARARLKL